MSYALAIANNDVVFLAWDPGLRIDNCLGFDIRRREGTGRRRSLPAWVGFAGDTPIGNPQTTATWPVQKYSWRDLTAKRGATYTYEIVPMIGMPGSLTRSKAVLTSNSVTLSPQRSAGVSAYFNRGLLATQYLARLLPKNALGAPDPTVLLTHISTPGDSVRKNLAGQIIEGVTSLLNRAKTEGGHCFCALYELADAELVAELTDAEHVTLLLSNAGADPDADSTNAAARATLHAAGLSVTDRMLGAGHIGHNKFVVYVDPAGIPQAVLTGSTNWTSTGLCCQSNNALLIQDTAVANHYLDYWQRLKAESPMPRATQTKLFRSANQPERTANVDGASVSIRFSPNTQLISKPSTDPERPADLAQVFDLIAGAKTGVVFLLFQPGKPSVLDAILAAQVADAKLFVRGAATDPTAIEEFGVDLYHRTNKPAHVAAASGIKDDFAYWQQELLKLPGAHAIVHDKILVIDPNSETDCVVITGSHNLGYRASYNNDDNLMIIRGHRSLAQAYTTHVLDVYDHYRWRYTLQTRGGKAWTGLNKTATWQGKYFSGPIQEEFRFWAAAVL